jgi:hypothetical protein
MDVKRETRKEKDILLLSYLFYWSPSIHPKYKSPLGLWSWGMWVGEGS